MPNLTSVTVTAGVPTAGTGTVSTLDALMALLNANGQTTMSASAPVAIASDQTAIAVKGSQVTVSTDITRPANTTTYADGDNFSDSTSAPTSGGFQFSSAGRASGGSGIITDMVVVSSNPAATTALQGEVWIFDSSVTNINDNSAFSISDAEAKTLVAKIPFTMVTDTNNSAVHVTGATSGTPLPCGFTCVGSANLRYLVKVKNAYPPISGEVLTVRLKIIQTT